MRVAVWVVAAVACALCAGCSAGAAVPDNRPASLAEANRLLALEPVPDGAAFEPLSVPGPALGLISTGPMAQRQAQWRLSMPFAQAAAWLQAHRPAGLGAPAASGTRTAAQGGARVAYAYEGPPGAAWAASELQAEVTPDGPGAAFLRADAMVVWVNPATLRDNASGKRVRIAVAGRCPRSDDRVVGVTNSGAGLRSRLVPGGSPTAGLVCSYYGVNGPMGPDPAAKGTLRYSMRLSAAQARGTAAEMRGLSLVPPPPSDSGSTTCMADDGSEFFLALRFPGRPDVDLAEISVCGWVANGFIKGK